MTATDLVVLVAGLDLECWEIEEIKGVCDRWPIVVMALCCKKKYLHFAQAFISKMRMIPDNKNIKGEYQ